MLPYPIPAPRCMTIPFIYTSFFKMEISNCPSNVMDPRMVRVRILPKGYRIVSPDLYAPYSSTEQVRRYVHPPSTLVRISCHFVIRKYLSILSFAEEEPFGTPNVVLQQTFGVQKSTDGLQIILQDSSAFKVN